MGGTQPHVTRNRTSDQVLPIHRASRVDQPDLHRTRRNVN
jgi:hypothetical protein